MSENSGPKNNTTSNDSTGRGRGWKTNSNKSKHGTTVGPTGRGGNPVGRVSSNVKAMDAETARETRRLFRDVKKTIPKIDPTPDPDPHKKKKKKKKSGPETPEPKVVTPTPTTGTTPKTNLIDNINLTKKYNDEIARLTLELISQSESLLLAYDFKGIDFVPSHYLESGDEARNTKIITESNRPVSTEADVNSAELKYNVSNAINSIIAKIGDGQSEREKYFGSIIPGQNRINPKKATISNNVATFDLEISDILIAGASGFTIKLYEVV